MNFKVWLEELTASLGYWISPMGEATPVRTTHIGVIFDNPEAFGLTEEELKAVFLSFEEPFGSEGKAREKIMIDLMKEGWIRLRHRDKPDGWTAELGKANHHTMINLVDWAHAMQAAGRSTVSRYSEITIKPLDGHPISKTFEDLLGRAA